MLKLLTLDDSAFWSMCLSKLPIEQQDIYFTPEYYKLYEDNGDGKAFCFVFEKDDDIALYPFLSNRINDLGYDLDKDYYDIQGAYGYNGIVTSGCREVFIDAYFDSFRNYCIENNIVSEFIRFHPLLGNYNISNKYCEVIFDRKTINLHLSDGYDNIYSKQYSGNCRNMLRKANKANYSVLICNDSNSYKQFYHLYHDSMKRVSADTEYFFPVSYFEYIGNVLSGKSFVVMVFIDSKPVAGALFLTDGMYCHYHLSGRNVQFSDNSITNSLIDVAIREAINRGVKYFHFGGGRTSEPDDSLLRFKKNFSKRETKFYIGKKVFNDVVYRDVVRQWKEKYPSKVVQYGNRIQCYRYIDEYDER